MTQSPDQEQRQHWIADLRARHPSATSTVFECHKGWRPTHAIPPYLAHGFDDVAVELLAVQLAPAHPGLHALHSDQGTFLPSASVTWARIFARSESASA
jgi:hypothetical protein